MLNVEAEQVEQAEYAPPTTWQRIIAFLKGPYPTLV